MARFDAVLFDLDGTLTDPGSGIFATIRRVLAALEVAPPPVADLRWCIGPPLREIFTRLLEPLGKNELVERAASLYLQYYAVQGASDSTVYRGVEGMLQELRGKARLFVVTNKNRAIAQRIIGTCALSRYFEAIAGNARVAHKSDIVCDLIERERIGPAAAIVGDRADDVIAGKRNGICAIGVTYGYGTCEELAAAGADQVCATPAAVARFILAD